MSKRRKSTAGINAQKKRDNLQRKGQNREERLYQEERQSAIASTFQDSGANTPPKRLAKETRVTFPNPYGGDRVPPKVTGYDETTHKYALRVTQATGSWKRGQTCAYPLDQLVVSKDQPSFLLENTEEKLTVIPTGSKLSFMHYSMEESGSVQGYDSETDKYYIISDGSLERFGGLRHGEGAYIPADNIIDKEKYLSPDRTERLEF